tara:strand:+ start:26157 stop:26804 length:648 start_codon:yes stop_codon:yes gene_type:complete
MLGRFNVVYRLAIFLCLFSVNATEYEAGDSAFKSNNLSEPNNLRKIGQLNCPVTELDALIVSDLTEVITQQHFTLLGKAKLSVLFWDIYESSLLTTDGQVPFSNVCQHSLFEIQYLRDISKQDLLDNTAAQWRHLSLNENEYLTFLPLLEKIWLDINAGDRLSMLNQKDKTLFYLNGKNIGEIQSLTFAETFLDIWLDENTSEPKLRLKLLGNSI